MISHCPSSTTLLETVGLFLLAWLVFGVVAGIVICSMMICSPSRAVRSPETPGRPNERTRLTAQNLAYLADADDELNSNSSGGYGSSLNSSGSGDTPESTEESTPESTPEYNSEAWNAV